MYTVNYLKVREEYKPIINTILSLKKNGNIHGLHNFVNNMEEFQYGFTLILYYIGMLGVESGSTKEEYLRMNIDSIKRINREYCKFFEARYDVLEKNLYKGLDIFSEM
ncbi:hypothetical protein [Clostridium sp. UBA1652]|uniref:hypothetical protein n=1 Tax=Clostridium sp. UBA1652 TaxID=1946348 RepID=UPI002579877F|nr:hypothetical protein [Clostridium sp. UBA1652]